MNTPASNMHKTEYLIVGQGLAGSILAWTLLQQGASVYLVDNSHQHSSSVVAAGLVNPVTGKRLLKTEDTDKCLPAALDLYQQLSQTFEQTFYHPLSMLRLFKDQVQADIPIKRLDDAEYQPYLDRVISDDEDLHPFKNTHGGIFQKQTGYLDIPLLLSCLKSFFQQKNLLVNTPLDYADLAINPKGVSWRDIQADYCIFCEGYQAINNPWFDWLPFQPAKGEILTIASEQIPTGHIINKGNWIIPTGHKHFRTGSTNVWQYADDQPTQEGRQEIESALQQLFINKPEYQVVDQQAGVRPATRDKKPFIGFHAESKRLAVFNGFGARGSMMIPYYAELFSQYLLTGQSLPAEVDIHRFARQ